MAQQPAARGFCQLWNKSKPNKILRAPIEESVALGSIGT
jgi:hypothetical protein